MKKILSILTLCFSVNAFSSTVFIGSVKGTGVPCTLEIEQTYFEDNIEIAENFRAEIAISLEDGDDHKNLKHEDEMIFIVKPSAKPNIFSGVGANQLDQVNLLVTPGTIGVESPVAVSIKWLHGNHYHTAQCLNLKPVDHE